MGLPFLGIIKFGIYTVFFLEDNQEMYDVLKYTRGALSPSFTLDVLFRHVMLMFLLSTRRVQKGA